MPNHGTPPSGTTPGVCKCGHPLTAHEPVDGFDYSSGVVNSHGVTGEFDLLVCTGHRLAAVGGSPWDHVCGCVLYPATERNLRLQKEARRA